MSPGTGGREMRRYAMTAESRYIPKNATALDYPGLGTVYVYPWQSPTDHKFRYGVKAYRPKAGHPDFDYLYKTDAEVDRKIEQWLSDIRAHQKRVEDRRKAELAGHSFVVGDIVTNSWGYDQTNVDWYRVTRTTKNYVWLKPVHSILEPSEGCGPMSGNVGLALDENLKPIDGNGPETKHKAVGDNVTMRHGSGSKYTGGTKYESWYA
jgi:hypothetical protein